jgi:hypothetical protein
MPGETFQEVFRVVGTEIVQKQERVEQRDLAEPEYPFQVDAGAFDGRLASEYFADFSGSRHWNISPI